MCYHTLHDIKMSDPEICHFVIVLRGGIKKFVH